MKVKLVETAETVRTLEIEVDAEAVTLEYERQFSRQAANANMAGFRKGKVPRGVLEARIGASVEQEAVNTILPKATLEAVREHKLRMVGTPSIESLDYKKSSPLVFKARVEVKPQLQLKGSLEGLKLSAPSALVAEKDIDEQVHKLRERAGTIGPELDRPAAMGDSLLVDFEGRINGEVFQGGKAENFNVVLGRRQLIPGFEEGLVGAKKGETREINVEFPADYNAADVAGKKAVFTVHVTEIREIQLPAVDDEFAKSLGGVDTVAAMRDAILKAVGSAKERSRRLRLQDQVAGQLLEKYPVAVPQAMVESELGMLVDREVSNLKGQGMEPQGEEGLKSVAEQLKPMAEKRARLSLILESVADAQQMTVSEEEFEADMAQAAPQLGMTLAQTVAWVKQNGREGSVKSRLREEKALSFLIDKANIKEE